MAPPVGIPPRCRQFGLQNRQIAYDRSPKMETYQKRKPNGREVGYANAERGNADRRYRGTADTK